LIAETIPIWNGSEDAVLECCRLHLSHEPPDPPRPAAVICPGGAYLGTSDREAEPVAARFLAKGYHTFTVRYTTYYGKDFRTARGPGNPRSVFPQPLLDLAKATALVRERAEEWRVDPGRIVVVGFSAGGHLAATLGVRWHEEFLARRLSAPNEAFRPNALVLSYALLDLLFLKELHVRSGGELAIPDDRMELWKKTSVAVFGTEEPTDEQLRDLSPARRVSALTPPTFLWHTAEDDLVDAGHSLLFAMELAKRGIPYELHVYEKGPHGISLGDASSAGLPGHIQPHAAGWLDLAFGWLEQRFGPVSSV